MGLIDFGWILMDEQGGDRPLCVDRKHEAFRRNSLVSDLK